MLRIITGVIALLLGIILLAWPSSTTEPLVWDETSSTPIQ
jgi:hypothetical protein